MERGIVDFDHLWGLHIYTVQSYLVYIIILADRLCKLTKDLHELEMFNLYHQF